MTAAPNNFAPGESLCPPGWRRDPSAEPHRWWIAILAAFGFLISLWMAFYEWGVIDFMFEPFFDAGSNYILRHSPVARYFMNVFGFPDAFFGAAAYLAEMLMSAWEGPGRWRTAPWIPITQGSIALGMAVAAILLVIAQIILGHWCTLCLTSAVVSWLIVVPAVVELWPALRHVYLHQAPQWSFWATFWGVAH